MYSTPKLAYKFLQYWLKSNNGKGHGMHSPFVFDFLKSVLNDDREFYAFKPIEAIRTSLKTEEKLISITDYGAGSRTGLTKERKVSAIAKSSLKPKKYSQLLFKMANYYGSNNILELGTSLGITTSYLASANEKGVVTTMEGAATIASIAKQNFSTLNLNNITVIEGNFDTTLQEFIALAKPLDFIYLDGNHQYKPTLNYYTQVLKKCTPNAIIILDDIHWSKEMENAWKWVKDNTELCITVDLFFIGIVFINQNFLSKQHFEIRY